MSLQTVAEIRAYVRRWTAYPDYRDSGVEWLGKVPKHWKVKRLKDAVKLNPDVLSEDTTLDWSLRYLDIGNVDSAGHILSVVELTFERAPVVLDERSEMGTRSSQLCGLT